MGARVLIAQLRRSYGYETVRQRGSHIRIRTVQNGEHSVSVPNHNPIRTGTLAGILADVAEHFGVDEDAVLEAISGRSKRSGR